MLTSNFPYLNRFFSMLHFKGKLLQTLALIGIVSFTAQAQKDPTENFWSRSNEIGLNFTPFLSKLIPFNFTDSDAGLVGLNWKSYGLKNAFRMSFGANLAQDDFFNTDNYLYLSIGYEKRRGLGKNWSYTTGWEAILEADEKDESSFIGASKFFGIEYNFTDRIYVSTEGALRMGFSSGLPAVQIDLPIALFFNVRLFKNAKK